MDIICASICYRGYAEDEVAATLEMAPRIGYEFMEVHGPMAWSVEAVQALDADALCHRLLTQGWSGGHYSRTGATDDADVDGPAQPSRACNRRRSVRRHIRRPAHRGVTSRGLERVAPAGRVLSLCCRLPREAHPLEPHYAMCCRSRMTATSWTLTSIACLLR